MLSFMYRTFKVQTLEAQLKFWVTVVILIPAVSIMMILAYYRIHGYKELAGLFVGFLFILAGSWLLAIRMTKHIKSPLDRLSQNTRLMQEGNYQAKIEMGQMTGSPQELQDLCKTFNRMAATIEFNINMLDDYLQLLDEQNKALMEAEQKYRTLVEASPLGVVIIQGNEFVYTSHRIAAMLGYTHEEFSAHKAFIDHVYPEDRAYVQNQRKKMEGEVSYTSYQVRALTKEGAILHIEVYSTTCMYEGRTSVIATLLDVTEKERTKLALQQAHDELDLRVRQRTAELQKSYSALEAEIQERKKAEEILQRYQLLVEQAHDIILMIDIDNFQIIDANEAAVSAYGYSREELLARKVDELFGHGVTPLDEEQLQQLMEKGLLFESVHRRQDGSYFPVDVSIFVGTLQGQRVFMSIIHDITERKQAEMAMLEARERIARAERLASLGTMAAGIAHEINQPLNSIKVTADSLLYWYKKGKEHKCADIVDDIKSISVQAGRIDKIIKHMRAMVHGQNVACQCINLNYAVEGALDLIQSQLERHGIRITKLLDSELPPVRGALTQLEGVVVNLAVNAMQSLDTIDRTDKEIILKTYCDEHVILEIIDNGNGIDDETREKMFTPFFTTKPVGEGMGMGLSIVHSVITSYNGEIHVSKNQFGGATFQIRIPKA